MVFNLYLIFVFSYLEENADKVQGLPMNSVAPTYENIASFAYPGARPLYVYVKKQHMRAIPGLSAYLDEWVKSWAKDGPLAKIGMVVMPPEAMEANAAKVREQTVLTREELAAKGVEQKTTALMSEIVEDILPDHPLAALSGPSFAAEVARGLPVALTLACKDAALGRRLIAMLGSPMFRLYQSEDIVGAEIGGAVKNVLAIACGIVEGRGLGDNARAALITRGLAELMRLGRKKGAATETMMGLAGLGDLVLTCNAIQSRNFSFGHALGQGKSAAEILAERVAVTEGVTSAVSVIQLAAALGVDMPICAAVHAIIHEGRDIDTAIRILMDRPLTSE